MLGKHYLCAVVTQEESHGQAAPASSSSLGSRQGLWLTPRANEPDSDPNFAARNADRGAHCHGTLSSQAKELWPTITAHTPDMESNGPNGHSGTYLAGAVKQEQWSTPTMPVGGRKCRSGKRKGELLLDGQAKAWATPRTPTGGPESAQRKQELGRKTSGGGDLASQASGKLNPRWVETLMGLPIGWTMPSCSRPVTIERTSCDSSATESCRPPQSERSEFLLASWPSPRAGESQQTDELSRLWVECGYKQPKTRGGKPRANNSTYDVTLETAVRGVAKAEANQ